MTEDRLTNDAFVPIIGRPNVGKSTLFNHLLGEDRSITGSKSGITRDRISENLTWDDTVLTLIDTAGYETENAAPVEEFVLDQVEGLIDRADCLLFVVDGKTGVTELDRKIAEKLYTISDRVLLVVNKIDPPSDIDRLISDFYELGFESVTGVSAQHERNLETIKQSVVQKLDQTIPETESDRDDDTLQLSLVGRPNTGKSTLFNAILGYERVMVSDEPGTTRDYVSVSFDVEDHRFRLLDTGGLIRKNSVDGPLDEEVVYGSLRAIDFSDVVCLVLDWNQRVTHQDQRIAGLINDRYRGCIILVNKADDVDETNEDNWLDHLQDRLYFLDYAPVLFTSGETRRGLGAIFRTAIDVHNEMTKWFDAEKLTNTFLELKSELSWPSRDAQEVILQELNQSDIDPITFSVKAKNPQLLTKNDLRYLSRTLRNKLNIEISPVKLRVYQDDPDES